MKNASGMWQQEAARPTKKVFNLQLRTPRWIFKWTSIKVLWPGRSIVSGFFINPDGMSSSVFHWVSQVLYKGIIDYDC